MYRMRHRLHRVVILSWPSCFPCAAVCTSVTPLCLCSCASFQFGCPGRRRSTCCVPALHGCLQTGRVHCHTMCHFPLAGRFNSTSPLGSSASCPQPPLVCWLPTLHCRLDPFGACCRRLCTHPVRITTVQKKLCSRCFLLCLCTP